MDRFHEGHINMIKIRSGNELDSKYREGQEEHGGNLWEKPMAHQIREETLDLITYSHVLQDQHHQICEMVEEWLAHPDRAEICSKAILKYVS